MPTTILCSSVTSINILIFTPPNVTLYLVLCQLDYVNSILSKTPTTTMKPYQTAQNFAARLAHKKSRIEDVYICLQELHWLPIK